MRLLVGTSLATTAILALLGAVIYHSVRHALSAEFDAALRAKANSVASMVEQTSHGIGFDPDLGRLPEFLAGKHSEYFEVWDATGRALNRSASLQGHDLPRDSAHADVAFADIAMPNEHTVRSITVRYAPASDADEGTSHPTASKTGSYVVLTLARPTRDLHSKLERLRWLLIVCCAGAIVASGAVLLVVVGLALRPVDRIATEIESIGVSELNRQIAIDGVPVELQPVVLRLNGLIGRLGEAFTRERAFTADVAHELRTPLAGLQATLDVCVSRRRETAEYETTIAKCQLMIHQMRAIVENLLTLARADAGHLEIVCLPTDICVLIQECWADRAERGSARKLNINWELPDSCVIDTDPEKLRIVIHNLLDNALGYVNEGGLIRISVTAIGSSHAQISIANTGSRVSAVEVGSVFQRFWRGDSARTLTGERCGLGLSLCHRLVDLLGGTIHAKVLTEDVFQIRVRLPR